MNLNNLQGLKREVKDLGFNLKVADELEQHMRTDTKYFTLKDSLPGDTGQVDMTLHFSKSKESDFYNFRKFEAVAGKIPLPTVENQHYMVLVADKDNPEKPFVNPFESPNEALDFFKKQKGNSELALGDSGESKQILASTENGKVNYVNEDFSQAFYGSGVKQNFYLSNGAGFTASHAANMVQGRTVYRENMINPKNGDVYNAWIKLDVALGKDNYGNLKLKQMNDPNFGFNLEKTLDGFKIKELADPAKKEAVIAAMKNGDRVALMVINKENKEVKLLVEAVPQYKTLDFYKENGAKEKRELYKKPEAAEQSQGKSQGKSKDKDLEETKSMSIR